MYVHIPVTEGNCSKATLRLDMNTWCSAVLKISGLIESGKMTKAKCPIGTDKHEVMIT